MLLFPEETLAKQLTQQKNGIYINLAIGYR
jgi:hypothetical protein